ncbi:MAG: tetratricopeptide repeat protein [Chloroflexi bacterium]|nr:tetratricopeptide repeat protein [Chloroflexota bacterium]
MGVLPGALHGATSGRRGRGGGYHNLGQAQRAIDDYDEAIRLDPQLADAYTNRANAHSKLGHHQWALQDYNEAIRLEPKNALAYANRALVYTDLGRDVEAQEDVDRAAQRGFDRLEGLEQFIETIKDRR